MKLHDVDLLSKFDLLHAFVQRVANLTADGDMIADDDEVEYVMENDDAATAFNGLIHEARALLGAS